MQPTRPVVLQVFFNVLLHKPVSGRVAERKLDPYSGKKIGPGAYFVKGSDPNPILKKDSSEILHYLLIKVVNVLMTQFC